MVWQLSIKHKGEQRAWNFVFATRKECLQHIKSNSELHKYKRRFDEKRDKGFNEWLLNSNEYMIKKIYFWYDGA